MKNNWHFLPEKPKEDCFCILKLKDQSVKPARFIQYICGAITGEIKDLSFFEVLGGSYDDDSCLEEDEIECWCSMQEVAELLE